MEPGGIRPPRAIEIERFGTAVELERDPVTPPRDPGTTTTRDPTVPPRDIPPGTL